MRTIEKAGEWRVLVEKKEDPARRWSRLSPSRFFDRPHWPRACWNRLCRINQSIICGGDVITNFDSIHTSDLCTKFSRSHRSGCTNSTRISSLGDTCGEVWTGRACQRSKTIIHNTLILLLQLPTRRLARRLAQFMKRKKPTSYQRSKGKFHSVILNFTLHDMSQWKDMRFSVPNLQGFRLGKFLVRHQYDYTNVIPVSPHGEFAPQ